MPNGKFNQADVERLKELGELINSSFGDDKRISFSAEEIPMQSDTQRRIRLSFENEEDVAFVELKENIAKGQRVEIFRILEGNGGGSTVFILYHIDELAVNTLLCILLYRCFLGK